MTNRERTGFRDKAYSTWHRELSDSLSFIDIDWIEWCSTCKKRLAVYELAFDDGKQDNKNTWVTRGLAKSADIKGFLVLYSKDADGRISGFRVRELYPRESEGFTAYTPDEWADRLYKLRWCHPLSRTEPRPVTPVRRPRAFVAPLGPPRMCPACHQEHPVRTTCGVAA